MNTIRPIYAGILGIVVSALTACGGGEGADDTVNTTEANANVYGASAEKSSAVSSAFTTIESTKPIILNDWMHQMVESERARGVAIAQPRPVIRETVTQNPPSFAWPLHKFTQPDQAVRYSLQIRFPDGSVQSFWSDYNWYLPRTKFPAGNYSWRVVAPKLGAGGADDIGMWRPFTITEDAKPLFDDAKLAVVATDQSWFNAVSSTAHPRIISDTYLQSLRPQFLSQRLAVWNEIKRKVALQASDPAKAPPQADMSSSSWIIQLPQTVNTEQDRIEMAAMVWRMQKNSSVASEQTAAAAALKDLKARTFNLASWSTEDLDGQGSGDDSTVRNLLWALVLGYDNLYPVLTSAERNQLLSIIATRASQLETRVIGPNRSVEHYPLDSSAAVGVYALSAATAVMAGDMSGGVVHPQFDSNKFARYVPMAYSFLHASGGDDGGFGNGGGYGLFDVNNVYPYYDALGTVTGVDPYRLQKLRNSMEYQLFSRPAGGDSQAPFGDGTTVEGPQVPYYAYWWATRLPGQISNWMATVYPVAATHSRLARTLLSPPVTPVSTSTPGVTELSKLFKSTGTVFMHSSLTDPQRTSVHFKSSPFGSYNHNHADQNSFVVSDQGKALLIDSGYYDYFLSAHSKGWYRQTKAHNAITYNGGLGQRIAINGLSSDYSAAGSIVGYADNGEFTISTGDATTAYDAPITRARRTVVYLRKNLVLVHDDLAASTPVRWEWNFHSLTNPQLSGGAAGTVKVVNGAASACIKQIGGDRFTTLGVNAKFPVDPAMSFTQQYHGTWSISSPATQWQSVMLVDIGCKETTAPTVTTSGDNITVAVGDKQFRFTRNALPAYAN